MNILNSQSQKVHSSNRHNKKRLSQDQVRLLEASFDYSKKLEPEQKHQLARQLGVPPRQIAIWYQNKRARWKNQSLELDYSALQLRLETALAEKRQLEKEVEQLQGELQKAQETLITYRQSQDLPPISFSASCCDEGGSSSLHEDVSCSWENGREALQLEELYACLVGAEGSNHSSFVQNEKFSLYKV